jgi:hypothetical protein
MSEAQKYRQHARHCVEISADFSDQTSKLLLLEMAQAWIKLADQAEKNQTLDLVYETPETAQYRNTAPQRAVPQTVQPPAQQQQQQQIQPKRDK